MDFSFITCGIIPDIVSYNIIWIIKSSITSFGFNEDFAKLQVVLVKYENSMSLSNRFCWEKKTGYKLRESLRVLTSYCSCDARLHNFVTAGKTLWPKNDKILVYLSLVYFILLSKSLPVKSRYYAIQNLHETKRYK